MPLARQTRRAEKGGAYYPRVVSVRDLEERLQLAKDGHFPVLDGDRVIGVLVSLDRFNVLAHLAELLDDPQVAAAVASARSKKQEEERFLSFEENIR